MRTLLPEPRESGRPDSAASDAEMGKCPVGAPQAAQKWAAVVLAEARHRRPPHVWPAPKQQAVRDEPVIGALVRAYVLSEDERARALASPAREIW